MRLLTIDVGLGTADILVFDDGLNIENCPRLVIPSGTQRVAAEIRSATGMGLPVVFDGVTMGGGASGKALREHLESGLTFYSSPAAALTFNDDIEKVAAWGVRIFDDPATAAPAAHIRIESADIDFPGLTESLARLSVDTRFDGVAIAVQDHGYSPGASNRKRRFQLWREALERDDRLDSLAYPADRIPDDYSRMRAVASLAAAWREVVVMDTGPAALLGAAQDAGVAEDQHNESFIAANLGNGHTLAAIVSRGRLQGLVEHHTSLMGEGRFAEMIRQFTCGGLSDEEVFQQGGHGCIPPRIGREIDQPVIVTGPRRSLAAGSGLSLHLAAPYGDMMMTGCFGLVEAWRSVSAGRAF